MGGEDRAGRLAQDRTPKADCQVMMECQKIQAINRRESAGALGLESCGLAMMARRRTSSGMMSSSSREKEIRRDRWGMERDGRAGYMKDDTADANRRAARGACAKDKPSAE